MTNTKSVLLGIPSYNGEIRIELAKFIAEFEPHQIFPLLHRPLPVARNIILHQAQKRNVDVLFMCDGDADPAPGTYQALLEQAQKEICVVGVPYYLEGRSIPITLKNQTEPIQHLKGMQEVENIGGHLCAYNMKAFDRIEPPYFYFTYNENNTVHMTEDYVGHERLYNKGVKIYAAMDHWAGHLKTINITLER